MEKIKTSTIVAQFRAMPEDVWNIVTDNTDYTWRSDLQRVDVIDAHHFIEIAKNGASTEFTITKKEEYLIYEFDMKNQMFDGTWRGEFSETENAGTQIVFTEHILIHNILIRCLSYFLWDLKKIQQKYVDDLRARLNEV